MPRVTQHPIGEPGDTGSPSLSRRGFLGAAALGVGATGVVAIANPATAATAAAGAPTPADDVTSAVPRRIDGTGWRWQRGASDQGATRGDLVDDRGRVGTFRSIPLGPGAHLHVLTFGQGTLLAIGSGLETGAYAVVGGTGIYAGCTGAYTCSQSPKELGGTGTAAFNLTTTGS